MQVVSTSLQTVDGGSRSANSGEVGYGTSLIVLLSNTISGIGTNQTNYIGVGVSIVKSIVACFSLVTSE